jgi:uncharacterized RDD family membrane protein YckC
MQDTNGVNPYAAPGARIIFADDRRTLHDRIADTVVIDA